MGSARRIGLFALGLAFIMVMVSAYRKTQFSAVNEIGVEIVPLEGGHSFLSPQEVRGMLDKRFEPELVGSRTAEVDLARVEQVLEEEPFIQDADVYLNARRELQVRIYQRMPVLRIMDNHDFNYYLDQDGLKMPLSSHYTARVLTVTGNLPAYDPNFRGGRRNALAEVFELAALIRQDEFLQPLIEQIHVANNGDLTMVPKIGKQKILFGPCVDMEDKLHRLILFYKQGMPYVGWNKYDAISLKYKGQVIGIKD